MSAYSENDFKFGTGDFTIEYWFFFNGISGSNSGCFQISNTSGGLNNSNTASAGGLALNYENGCVKGIGNNGWFNGTNSVAVETWNHVALVRHNGTLRIYTNGAVDTTASDSNDYSLTYLAIGGYYTTSYLFSGYISNFRIQKGKAEYTGAFTPPTRQLEVTPETVLFACHSSGSILQEERGKTLDVRKVNIGDAPPLESTFVPDVGNDHTHGTVLEGNVEFPSLNYMTLPRGTTTQSNRGRGLLMGGAVSPGATNTTQIKYFDIASQGTTNEFGQTTLARRGIASVSSSTRGCVGGGFVAPPSPYVVSDVIDYVTIATTANAIDFGNMQSSGYSYATASNQTRGLFAGGYRPNNSAVVDTIDLITIATAANATDFGNLSVARRSFGGLASPTRGIFMGGTYPAVHDVIDYVTIASAGDATDFGDLTDARDILFGSSSSTRGVMAGGRAPSNTNIIDYITMATTGNATDFGDLLAANYYYSATSNSTRGVWLGNAGLTNTIEYVTIATTGNSIDWGDQGGSPSHSGGACSDSHGGLT